MKRIRIDGGVQFIWALANAEACFSGSTLIEPVHFSLAFLNVFDDLFKQQAEEMGLGKESVYELLRFSDSGREMLNSTQDNITEARRSLKKRIRIDDGGKDLVMLHRSDISKQLFKRAGRAASGHSSSSLTLPYIWEQVLYFAKTELSQYFPNLQSNITHQKLTLDTHSQNNYWQSIAESSNGKFRAETPIIDELCRDLTALAKQDRLPSIVSRDNEIMLVSRFISKASKRNVILTGKAGVGKTAIVEGLAQTLSKPTAPKELRALRIVELRISDLIAGTKYRGDMEKRILGLIDEAESDPNLVMFIDEIHMMVKAGQGDGSIDIANIFKPALARDKIRCIGATTSHEYDLYIKKDKALLRRFQVLNVSAATLEQTIEIIESHIKRIEKIQHVRFDQDMAVKAVDLANTLISDTELPDSAIDLIENAASFAKITSLSVSMKSMTKDIPVVNILHLEQVINEIYHINPITLLDDKITNAAEFLKNRIIGQDAAIKLLIESLNSSLYRNNRSERPFSVLLFIGPTGTGKTFMAESLGKLFSDDMRKDFLRINMNEFKERHEIGKLIGAPPGFIGHDNESTFFRFAHDHPQGVILLDEMDKAHAEVQEYFLHIFDCGIANDSRGDTVNLKNIIFIMTSNMGESSTKRNIGFVSGECGAKENITSNKIFSEELLSRIDETIYFKNLSSEDYINIYNKEVSEFFNNLEIVAPCGLAPPDHNYEIIRDVVLDGINNLRDYRKNIENILFSPLRKLIRNCGDKIEIKITDGHVSFEKINKNVVSLK